MHPPSPPHPRQRSDPQPGPVCDRCHGDRSPGGWHAYADGAQVCSRCMIELEPCSAPTPASSRPAA